MGFSTILWSDEQCRDGHFIVRKHITTFVLFRQKKLFFFPILRSAWISRFFFFFFFKQSQGTKKSIIKTASFFSVCYESRDLVSQLISHLFIATRPEGEHLELSLTCSTSPKSLSMFLVPYMSLSWNKL